MLDCIRYLMRKGNGEERGKNMKVKVGKTNYLDRNEYEKINEI